MTFGLGEGGAAWITVAVPLAITSGTLLEIDSVKVVFPRVPSTTACTEPGPVSAAPVLSPSGKVTALSAVIT